MSSNGGVSKPSGGSANGTEASASAPSKVEAHDDIFSVGDVIRVPLAGGVKYVEVALKELPDDLEQVQKLLQYEYLPLIYWIQFAVAYYRLKKYDQFETLLKVASSEETIQALQDHSQSTSVTAVRPRERIRIQTMLAAYNIKQANNPTLDDSERAALFAEAEHHLNTADQIENFNPAIHSLSTACKGYRTFMQLVSDPHVVTHRNSRSSTFVLASKEFDGALTQMPDNEQFLHAELGRAALLFRWGQYAEAEAIYRDVLRRVPSCPAGVRVALGFCFDRLGKPKLAMKAMQRAVALEPHNEEALVALAILGRQASTVSSSSGSSHSSSKSKSLTPKELRRKYKEMLVTANVASTRRCKGTGGLELRNSACLNHLARYISTEWQSEGGIIKGIMTLTSGSDIARSSMDLRNTLRAGQLVRIGRYRFIVDPKRQVTETEVPLNQPHTGPSQADLVLEYPKLKESQEFAQMALENTSTAEIKAEAEYYIGRCFHASGDLAKAKEHYHLATELAGRQTRRAPDGTEVELAPFALGYFGLAQISIVEGNLDKALKRFQRLHQDYPDVPEIMLRIGYLHVMASRRDEALPFFKRTAELQKSHRNREGRLIALTMAAEILQSAPRRLEQQEALGYYNQALDIHKTSVDALKKGAAGSNDADTTGQAPSFVSPELLVNAGALNHNLGNLEEAGTLYNAALQVCELFGKTHPDCALARITARYNRARLLEQREETQDAIAAYKALVADHPNYVDAILRLAVLRGETEGVEAKKKLLQKAHSVSEGWAEMLGVGVQSSFAVAGTNATVMLGDLALEEGQLGIAESYYTKVSRFQVGRGAIESVSKAVAEAVKARKVQRRTAAESTSSADNAGLISLLGRTDPRAVKKRAQKVSSILQKDPYVGMRLANIVWEQRKAAEAKNDSTQADRELMRYEDALKKCLQKNSGNLFAANGLACALVEKDELDGAQDLLRRVREGSERTDLTPCPSAFINLAHVHMLRGDYNSARVEYERVLARFAPGGTDPRLDRKDHLQLLVYAASACNELAQFSDGVDYIEKALTLARDDPRLVIMLALTHQKWARHILLKAQSNPGLVSTAQLEKSLASLEVAREKFTWLDGNEAAATSLPKAQVDNLAANAAWCVDTEDVARQNIESSRARDAEKARLREEAQERRRQQQERVARAAKERAEAQAAAAEKLRKLQLAQRLAREEAARAAAQVAQVEQEEQEVDLNELGHSAAAKSRVATAKAKASRKPRKPRSNAKRKSPAAGNGSQRAAKAPAAKRGRRKKAPENPTEYDVLFGESDEEDSDEGDEAARKAAELERFKRDRVSPAAPGPAPAPAPAPAPVTTAGAAQKQSKSKRKIDSDSDSDSEGEEAQTSNTDNTPATKSATPTPTDDQEEEDDADEVVDQTKAAASAGLFEDL
eukprot:INCI16519.1.p1 GENE.INCI16519.1~~INCI16519.1.p1  ORF type:complete len:1415 (-),score=303.98 INCI16519.1:3348-7592(-)